MIRKYLCDWESFSTCHVAAVKHRGSSDVCLEGWTLCSGFASWSETLASTPGLNSWPYWLPMGSLALESSCVFGNNPLGSNDWVQGRVFSAICCNKSCCTSLLLSSVVYGTGFSFHQSALWFFYWQWNWKPVLTGGKWSLLELCSYSWCTLVKWRGNQTAELGQ